MRIAYFSETFLPKVDGVVNTVCRLIEHLEARGHSSILFAPRGGPSRYANTPITGFKGYPFPYYPELRLVPPTINASRELAEFEPDIIHVINPVSLGLVGLQYGRRKSIPVVASYHTDIPGFAARWGFGFLNPLIWMYVRSVHNVADLNLAPSRFTAEQIQSRGFRNVKIWGRGVDTNLYSPNKRSESWRRRLTRGDVQSPLLLYVGRLAIEKRVDWLSEVMKCLPTVHLAIVGDGPMRSELERMFADTNTVFTGYLTGEDLAQIYASADVFVFTGANETFGNVVLEALASGLPVVVPNSGGVVELVEDGRTGWLFEAESVVSLVETVSRCVDSKEITRQMGKTGRLVAESRSWMAIMDGLLDDYRLVLSHAKQRKAKPMQGTALAR